MDGAVLRLLAAYRKRSVREKQRTVQSSGVHRAKFSPVKTCAHT
jgi:hypothetical protein